MIVFCCDPLEPWTVDPTFAAEAESTHRLGIPHVLVDHDVLVRDNDPARAVRRVPEQPRPVLAAYRGWMVTPPIYRGLFEALAAIRSRFFTMDLARRRDGGWMIVELGDGQVSGLPKESDAERFHQALSEHWPGQPGP